MIDQLVAMFKALGEPTRLKIVKLLSLQEMCVCELVEVLEMSQPGVSQHLKVLKNAGIVRERKERQRSFYSLGPFMELGNFTLFNQYMEANLEEIADLQKERIKLEQLDDNETIKQCKAT